MTINGQSSSIMSVLVLGAGTDYALLIVARYREELHDTEDRHAAMQAAMTSAGPAVFASAATVIAALLCLTLAKVNGTSGLGPIGAMGVACAALSMLTLLPALLTIFGRRAFWPFVPHTPSWTAPTDVAQSGIGRRIVEGSRFGALLPVIGAALVAFILLPLTILTGLLRRFVSLYRRRVKTPSVVSLFDGPIFKPYEVRRTKHEHLADETHGFWKRVGDRVARPARVMTGSIVVLLVMCAGLAFFSTDLTTNDGYRTEVESVEGQDLLAKSFPAGASAPADVIVPPGGDVEAVNAALEETDGIDAVSEPVAEGEQGTLIQATLEPPPYSTEAFDLIEPIRDAATGAVEGTVVGGATAVEFDVREAAGWDSAVIPPIVLVVVFLILMLLLRAVIAPLILIGTVILSFLAALGVGYFVFDLVFDFPGSDPSLPLFAFVFLVALGVDYNIFLMARAREETLKHGTREGMLRALAVTGGVITSAGIVLAGTFSVLAVLPLVFLTEIGFVVAFGVLLDTFLVRSVLVPAIVLKLGPRSGGRRSSRRRTGPARARTSGRRDALEERLGGQAAAPDAARPGRGGRRGRRGCAGRVRRRRPRRASPRAGRVTRTRGGPSCRSCRRAPRCRHACAPRGGQQGALDGRGVGRRAGERSQNGRSRPTSSSDSAQSSRRRRRGRARAARAPARRGGRAGPCRSRSSAPVATSQTSQPGSMRSSRPASSVTTATPEALSFAPGALGVASACAITTRRQRAPVSNTPITLRECPRPGTVKSWTPTRRPAARSGALRTGARGPPPCWRRGAAPSRRGGRRPRGARGGGREQRQAG